MIERIIINKFLNATLNGIRQTWVLIETRSFPTIQPGTGLKLAKFNVIVHKSKLVNNICVIEFL